MDVCRKFILYADYITHIKKLNMKQRGELFTAILAYTSGEEAKKLDPAVDMIFGVIQGRIDRDTATSKRTAQKRAEAGKLGGRPRKSEIIKTESKEEKDNGQKIDRRTREARELFEYLWKLYPNKRGKSQVTDLQKKRLLEVGKRAMTVAIDRYKSDLIKDEDWRKPQNGSTFFNGGYIDYLDENYQPYETMADRQEAFARAMEKIDEEWETQKDGK